MCVGHVFATMEAKTILSTVLMRHRVTEIEDVIKGLDETLKVYFVLVPAKGIGKIVTKITSVAQLCNLKYARKITTKHSTSN